MQKNKIYPLEWAKLHPYMKVGETDNYYANLANKVASLLAHTPARYIYTENECRSLAIFLTLWFEDVVSETGIWSTFTNVCKQRYGAYLPFYRVGDDYIQGEVNLEDLYFLLWYFKVNYQYNEEMVDPMNSALMLIAEEVYEFLANEFEKAPINDTLYDAIYPNQAGGYFSHRDLLDWLCYRSYISITAEDELMEYVAEKLDKEEDDDEEDDEPPLFSAMQKYNIMRNDYLLNATMLPAILKPKDFLAMMASGKAGLEPWTEVETHPANVFSLVEQDKDAIYLKDILTDEVINVAKESFYDLREVEKLAPGSYLMGYFVHYGDAWHLNGILVNVDAYDREKREQVKESEKERRLKPTNRRVYEDFMRATGNKPYKIVSDSDAFKDFLENEMHYKGLENIQLPSNLSKCKGLVVTATPELGITFFTEYQAKCIADPDNPFYDKKTAQEKAITLCTTPNVITYELSCWLQDHGLLPDAHIGKSEDESDEREDPADSQEHKVDYNKLFQDNRIFITDYFFRKTRETNYPAEWQ